MSSAAHSPDFVTIVTNVGVFLAAAGTVVAAIWSAVKKIRNAIPAEPHTTHKVVGGMIMDSTTLLMWSESNRTVSDRMDSLTVEMRELRFVMTQLKDKL